MAIPLLVAFNIAIAMWISTSFMALFLAAAYQLVMLSWICPSMFAQRPDSFQKWTGAVLFGLCFFPGLATEDWAQFLVVACTSAVTSLLIAAVHNHDNPIS